MAHLKRLYGRAVMAETSRRRSARPTQIVSERGLSCASPRSPARGEGRGREVFEARPIWPTRWPSRSCRDRLADFKGIAARAPSAEVTEAEVDEALEQHRQAEPAYADKGEGAQGRDGDRVTIDFTGKMDGVEFEGGTGDDVRCIWARALHSGLRGSADGRQRPARSAPSTSRSRRLSEAQLAGKDAVFDVKVKEIEAPSARRSTTSSPSARPRGSPSSAKLVSGSSPGVCRNLAPEAEAPAPRRARQRAQFTLPPSLVEDEFDILDR